PMLLSAPGRISKIGGEMNKVDLEARTMADEAAPAGRAVARGITDLSRDSGRIAQVEDLSPEDEVESRLGRSKLFDLGQIDVQWDADLGTLWAFITPLDRPNYNLGLLRDTMAWQMETRKVFGTGDSELKYMVLGSRFPGVFNLGGDLEMFARC